MPLNDMTSKATVGAHREFEIHGRTLMHARERCAVPRFVREVEGNRVGSSGNGGQADSAHCNRVAFLEFCDQFRRSDREPARAAIFLDARNFADFFNDAGEHECPPKTIENPAGSFETSFDMSSRAERGIYG